jgi:hypothetical protein
MQLVASGQVILHLCEDESQESGRNFTDDLKHCLSGLVSSLEICLSEALDYQSVDQLLELTPEDLDWENTDKLGYAHCYESSHLFRLIHLTFLLSTVFDKMSLEQR